MSPRVAHLLIAILPFDHPEGVLHIGPDAGLDLLDPVYQRLNGLFLLVQRSALAPDASRQAK